VIAAVSPVYWYVTRGSAMVALLLFTLTVVLGVLTWGMGAPGRRTPLFVTHDVHRSVSLIALLFLAVHIITAIIDPYARLTWLGLLIPFASGFNTFYVGLGVIAFELGGVLIATSLMRHHMPPALWRRIHLLAWTMWPLSLVHGVGAGSDTLKLWGRAVELSCVAAVVLAVGFRLVMAWRTRVTNARMAVPLARPRMR
jgi:sulfoxide reductase heme-binding subunit YedZ